ncbi:MAG: metallophosphoesterase, partial [Candidatus Binataceae bacterium]
MAPRPRRPLSIVHTSDVHLETDSFGSGPTGDALRERVRRSFSGVIEIANERHVDMLLIVGDLFDSSRISEGAIGFALAEIAR